MLSVSEKEVSALSLKNLSVRYEYFIKRIGDQEEVCILKNTTGDYFIDVVDGQKLFHMWCAEEYAKSYLATNNRTELVPLVVDFDILGDDIYPLIKEQGIFFSIMPIKEQVGLVVHIDTFSENLKAYIDEWYGSQE